MIEYQHFQVSSLLNFIKNLSDISWMKQFLLMKLNEADTCGPWIEIKIKFWIFILINHYDLWVTAHYAVHLQNILYSLTDCTIQVLIYENYTLFTKHKLYSVFSIMSRWTEYIFKIAKVIKSINRSNFVKFYKLLIRANIIQSQIPLHALY